MKSKQFLNLLCEGIACNTPYTLNALNESIKQVNAAPIKCIFK